LLNPSVTVNLAEFRGWRIFM